jgi:hypothetical protein
MSQIAETQLILCTGIFTVLAFSLKRGLLLRIFGDGYKDTYLLPLKFLIICSMMYLAFFMCKVLWRMAQ